MPFPALPKAVMGLWFHHGEGREVGQESEDAYL